LHSTAFFLLHLCFYKNDSLLKIQPEKRFTI
jgi:hypothetical protein